MNIEIINKIKSRMAGELLPEQLNKLEEVLNDVFDCKKIDNYSSKNNKNLINQYIGAKKIEGCSKRTEEYYLSTLIFFEKTIKCDIRTIDTNNIREYLFNYQKINNCSNVTLDTVRRILSSFYKWLEEEGSKTEIENVHPHRFRHTMATRAIDKGMPIEQVQVLLGHTKIDTTLRYANVQQSNVRYSHQKFICP